jgi:epoxyqueuosine reductase
MTRFIEEIVRKHALPAENYIWGFADLSGLLKNKFKGFGYGISIGRKLDYSIVDKIIDGPTLEYHSHYRQINKDLDLLTKNISEDLNKHNIETLNIDTTVSTSELDSVYFNSLRTDLSHKMVATRAGLGWIGKTDLFISKKFGPRLRLVSILLKTPVVPESDPVNSSRYVVIAGSVLISARQRLLMENSGIQQLTGRSFLMLLNAVTSVQSLDERD